MEESKEPLASQVLTTGSNEQYLPDSVEYNCPGARSSACSRKDILLLLSFSSVGADVDSCGRFGATIMSSLLSLNFGW